MERARLYKAANERCFGVQIATKTIAEGVAAAKLAQEAGVSRCAYTRHTSCVFEHNFRIVTPMLVRQHARLLCKSDSMRTSQPAGAGTQQRQALAHTSASC